MMTLKQWKKDSNILFHGRTNPIIQDIDKLVGLYHRPDTSPNKQLKLLVIIYFLCLIYQNTKPNGKRGNAVGRLKDDVALELNSQNFQLQLGNRSIGLGRRKALYTDGRGAKAGLKGRYQLESVMPQTKTLEKLNLNTTVKAFGMSTLFEEFQVNLNADMNALDEYQQQAQQVRQQGGHLSLEDFAGARYDALSVAERLNLLYEMWFANGIDNSSMKYLSKQQREDFLVAMTFNGIYTMVNGQISAPMTGKSAYANTGLIYAISMREEMYVLPRASHVGGQWNHSSLLSGQPVICAGEVALLQGKILLINNSSGHYKPSTHALNRALYLLEAASVPLNDTLIFDKATHNYFRGVRNFRRNKPAEDIANLDFIFNQIP